MQRALASAVLLASVGICAARAIAQADVALNGVLRDFHGLHATQNDNGIGVTSTDFDQFNFGPLPRLP